MGQGPGAEGRGRQDCGPGLWAPRAGGSGSRQQRRRHGLLFRPLHAHRPLHFPAGEWRPLLGPRSSSALGDPGTVPAPGPARWVRASLGELRAGDGWDPPAPTAEVRRRSGGGVGSQCPRRDPSGPDCQPCASRCVCTRWGGRSVPSSRDRCRGEAESGSRGTKAFGQGAWLLLSLAPCMGTQQVPWARRGQRGAPLRERSARVREGVCVSQCARK